MYSSLVEAGGPDWGHMGTWAGGMALLGFIFMLAIVGLIVWLIVYSTRDHGSAGPGAKTPLEILDERYARGELEREEYREKRSDLEK